MTVRLIGNFGDCYSGLSTDTKPVDAKESSVFQELDTGANYVYQNGAWWGRSTDVKIQDQHTEVIDLKMGVELSVLSIIDGVNIDERLIDVETDGTVPTTTMTVCLKEQSAFYQGRPLNISVIGTNQFRLTMDTPFDYVFTVAGGCSLMSTNLAVDGSIAPVIFRVSPAGLRENVKWDITKIVMLFGGVGVTPADPIPDDSDFGIQPALTNGVVLRSVNGITKNIFNAKTNGDLRTRCDTITYQPASKDGIYTVTTTRRFAGPENNGVTVRLNANTDDELQLIVQDNLTHMTGGQIIARGHVVQ